MVIFNKIVKVAVLFAFVTCMLFFDCRAQDVYTPSNTVYKNNMRYDLQDQPLNGLMRVYNNKTGKLFMEIPYKNGKMHGTIRIYDKDGLLYHESICKNGKKITSYYVVWYLNLLRFFGYC